MPDLSIPLLVGAVVTAFTLAAALAYGRMQPMARRARRYTQGLAQEERARKPLISRRERLLAWLEVKLARIGLRETEARQGHENALACAGLRDADSVLLLQAALLALPTLGGLVGYLLAPVLLSEPGRAGLFASAALGIAVGALLPKLWLSNRIQKRHHALQRALPDALDLYVICAEAGLSLDAAMARVARELKPMAPPLADELYLTAIELGFLPNRHEAYSNLLRRAPLPVFRGLVGMFQQTERYGTPLADALRHLAADHRTETMMRAEEKAARLPAVLTVPMILFVLPPLFVVLVGPAIVQWIAMG